MVDRLGFRVYDHHLPSWCSVLGDRKRNVVSSVFVMQQSVRSFTRVLQSETLRHRASLSNKHLACGVWRSAEKCPDSSRVWKVYHRASSVSQQAVGERSSLFSVRGKGRILHPHAM